MALESIKERIENATRLSPSKVRSKIGVQSNDIWIDNDLCLFVDEEQIHSTVNAV